MATQRNYLGLHHGYHLYELSDGCIEGWRKDQRYLSNAKTIEGFFTQFIKKGNKEPVKKTKEDGEKKKEG